MVDVNDYRTKLMRGLDLQEPMWYIEHANQQELRTFAMDVRNGPLLGHKSADFDRARERLRNAVVARIEVAVRAAFEVGLVQEGAAGK